MHAECDKHYPSRPGQTSLVTAVTNINKPVTKINFWLRYDYPSYLSSHQTTVQKAS